MSGKMEKKIDANERMIGKKESIPGTFPARLFDLLNDCNDDLTAPLPLRWNDDGKSFQILDKGELCQFIPKVFNRKCNLYLSLYRLLAFPS
jgi:hypothetical protein